MKIPQHMYDSALEALANEWDHKNHSVQGFTRCKITVHIHALYRLFERTLNGGN